MEAAQLAETALETIARHRRVLVLRHDEADPRSPARWTRERGSGRPDLEVRGPDALPLSCDALQLRAPRDACATRKAERRLGRLRLRRTCPGCGRSAASVPSSGDGPAWRGPTSFPCAHGIRAS